MRHLNSVLLVTLPALLLGGTPSSAQLRQADAHMHGRVVLSLVVDGSRVSMQLVAPAADIIGFEHRPDSAAEQERLRDAIQSLSEPLNLFSFAPDANCTVSWNEAAFGGSRAATAQGHDDDHDDDQHGHRHEDAESGPHADFTGAYSLTCTGLTAETTLATRFFELYEHAETMEIEGLVNGTALRKTLTRQAPSTALR